MLYHQKLYALVYGYFDLMYAPSSYFLAAKEPSYKIKSLAKKANEAHEAQDKIILLLTDNLRHLFQELLIRVVIILWCR